MSAHACHGSSWVLCVTQGGVAPHRACGAVPVGGWRRHPFSRVLAKNVYNEFIADRHHIHMNSTQWLTLTDFVKHLGREGEPARLGLLSATAAAR